MRSKRIPALSALAFGLLIAFAPGASAQEGDEGHHSPLAEEVIELVDEINALPEAERDEAIHALEAAVDEQGGTHADAHCVAILVEGGTVEDCQDAPNPLLPETNELIWGSIGFVVVFGFLAWKGLPAIRKVMAERTEKIQGEIDAAERLRAEAEQEKANYEAGLQNAKAESARIIEEARQAADQLRADQQARLNEELAAARAQAQADIEAAKGQAMAELRNEVTSIAVGAAEQVVGANLDRDAQVRLVEDYINQVASAGRS